LDVDTNQNIAMQYHVMGVPTLMLFKGGKEAHRMTGYQPKKRILKNLESHLN
ncbi:MAG: thiol reductase thioredoxin, partial [Gammaproteobacteria bacterium]|nr:thiol reductase thioredoxin [candidate division Zixibacteria bacterium]NIR96450.1 thiol reductase thioredoxin [Gammaproteobacteria bacterium]NIR63625.1 thiol reductase thioredoxin [candidate division Zixibacteria bacterium]NIS45596.1 thiol reductase thioredoxin [candidate division Zixibacteria bacterium]NIU13713.1 thiol reductase thioredoxin [candidate division Zixibacteria bacterium]